MDTDRNLKAANDLPLQTSDSSRRSPGPSSSLDTSSQRDHERQSIAQTNSPDREGIQEWKVRQLQPLQPAVRSTIGAREDFSEALGSQQQTLSWNESASPTNLDEGSNLLQLVPGNERHILELVEREILTKELNVKFDDIVALHSAKRLLQEACCSLPQALPEYFVGITEPSRGLLLFGPPGTGKTMLAKAVASLPGITFFNCSACMLVSRYRRESEKIVRCVFEVARACSPSVILIDELDALMWSTKTDGEHAGSRLLITELFTQMDGVLSSSSNRGIVMVLATTNRPWDLDDEIRRRFETLVYVPLPDLLDRAEMFALYLKDVPGTTDADLSALARLTEGYSGADISVTCREAGMMPLRRLRQEFTLEELLSIQASGRLEIPQVSMNDIESAIASRRPSVNRDDVARFEKWDRDFASR